MASRIEHFETSIGAGALNNTSFTFAGGEGVVEQLDVFFPSGCVGLVTAQVLLAGFQVIPFDTTKVLRGNNREFTFPIEDYLTTNAWGILLNNSDTRSHTVTTTFHIAPIEPETVDTQLDILVLPVRG